MTCQTCGQNRAQNRSCPRCAPRAAAAPQAQRNNATLIALLAILLAIGMLAAMMLPPAPAAAAPQERFDSRPVQGLGRAVSGEIWKYVISPANIRDAPTAQGSSVVGKLRTGERVRGVMYRGLVASTFWFRLSDGRGYVSAVNLGDADPGMANDEPRGRPSAPESQNCYVETSSGNLRIRATPNGRVIGGMPSGTRVRAYPGTRDSYGNYWTRVDPIEGRYPAGWVSRDYVIC